jgi:hypothetical protein
VICADADTVAATSTTTAKTKSRAMTNALMTTPCQNYRRKL